MSLAECVFPETQREVFIISQQKKKIKDEKGDVTSFTGISKLNIFSKVFESFAYDIILNLIHFN